MDPAEDEAETECLAGHVEHGLELLAMLYTRTRNPNFIFNQGRCLEVNGRFDEAVLRFREFMRKVPKASPDLSQEVEAHIKDCQSRSQERHVPEKQPEIVAAPPQVVAPVSSPTSTPPVAVRATPYRWGAFVSASVGAAGLLTGIGFGIASHRVEHDVNQGLSAGTYDRRKDERGQLYSKLQWVGYGVGGLGLAGGIVLYLLGERENSRHRLSVQPSLANQAVGLTVNGAY